MAEVAVIVPVLRRPQNAAPFMESLRFSDQSAAAYAVCEPDDSETFAAWLAAGAQVIPAGAAHTFAEKVNLAYQQTDEPWLLLVGDDVRFHAGWFDWALLGVQPHVGVVGTNDLTNPRVMAGHHTTHPLIRRSYVDEVGASWDGPGIVCHPYNHWYCDDEIVIAAKRRNAWRMALNSKIEHLHPLFGKGEDDEVYRLGQSFADADGATFARRFAEHG